MDRLLELLEENPRANLEELADQLNESPEKIRERIESYEEKGVIAGYRTILNTEKMDQDEAPILAIIEISVSPQPDTGFESIAGDISNHPEVRECYLCSGDFDFLVTVRGEDLNQVSDFVARELAPNPNVTSTVSHFRLKTYKEQGLRLDGSGPDRRLSISL